MIETLSCGSFFTNCYVISNEKKECIVIDPGLSFNKNYNYIISKYKVLAVLLTHGHVDHIDGIGYFKDIDIYIGKKDEPFLFDLNLSLYNIFGYRRNYNTSDIKIKTVKDNQELIIGDFKIKCIETPGHTIGSISYQIGNDLFSGDALFNMSIGRTDFPTGNIKEMNETLKKIVTLYPNDINIHPGHGDETTLFYERKYNPYLSNL